MVLDAELAAAAVEERIARPLGMSTLEAAAGIYDVINAKMAAAIREVSVQRGYDPRRFVLTVAGGASAVHVCAIARDIGIPEIVIPRDPGVFSAFGMLTTDFKHDFVRTFPAVLMEVDAVSLRTAFNEMRALGDQTLAAEGVPPEGRTHLLKLDLRYEGQVHEVELTVADADLEAPGIPEAHRKFHERHAAIYAYATENDPVEVVNLRVTSVGQTWKTRPPTVEHLVEERPVAKGQRSVYFGHRRETVQVPIFDGSVLGPGSTVEGPAIVELLDTSVVVEDHYDLACDEYGNFHLRARGADGASA
jgi:N-methylhydantoinase A